MKKILTVILFFVALFCKGQNLVPNPSFEDTVAFPTLTAQIDSAIGWDTYRQSPDYFNACAPTTLNGVNVPQNAWGYQYAKSGNAYAGFTAFASSSTNFREYLGCTLNQPTQTGQKYFISFYVCRAHNMYGMQWACNNIGMRFSSVAYSVNNPAPISNTCHVHDSTIITDTTNWVKISGVFVSDTIYNYIVFGNFFEDSITTSLQIGPNLGYAYYYIDDIRISTDSNFVNNVNEISHSNSLLAIYPNLARDWLELRENDIATFEIVDVTGKIIYSEKDIILPKKISISHYSIGVYFIRSISNNKLFTNKFIKY